MISLSFINYGGQNIIIITFFLGPVNVVILPVPLEIAVEDLSRHLNLWGNIFNSLHPHSKLLNYSSKQFQT